jgi:hypothetical protein
VIDLGLLTGTMQAKFCSPATSGTLTLALFSKVSPNLLERGRYKCQASRSLFALLNLIFLCNHRSPSALHAGVQVTSNDKPRIVAHR